MGISPIVHLQSTVIPLLPRLHVGLPLGGQRPPHTPTVTRPAGEESTNGNPNRQGGIYSTRFIAHTHALHKTHRSINR